MKIESINHVTFNTANKNISTPRDINKGMYFKLLNIVKEAQTEKGVGLFDDTVFQLTIESDGTYTGSLFTKRGGDLIPILSTSGTNKVGDRMYIWNSMIDIHKALGKQNIIGLMPPTVPYVIDYIYDSAIYNVSAMQWTGDFTKCMGWILLSPESIR